MKERLMVGTYLRKIRKQNNEVEYLIIDSDAKIKYSITKELYYKLKQKRGKYFEIDNNTRKFLYEKEIITTKKIFEIDESQCSFIPFLWITKITKGERFICKIINKILPYLSIGLFVFGIIMMNVSNLRYYETPYDDLFYILLIAFNTFFHELGHVIAAVSIKSRPFCIGFLMWYKYIPIGLCVYMDVNERARKIDRVQESLAGIEINLLLAGLIAIMISRCESFNIVLYQSIVMNVLLVITNLIPISITDGYRVLELIKE